jgi:hypothetical protein
MDEKTILESRGDKTVRVADTSVGQTPVKYSIIYAIVALFILPAVFHFYFGFGALRTVIFSAAAIILIPIAITLAVLVLFLVVWVIAVVPFQVVKVRRNRRTRDILESLHTGKKSGPVILFLRQFDPNRGTRFELRFFVGDQKHGSDLLEDDFKAFNLNHWADELSSPDISVLKVADNIDVDGGSIRLENDTWKTEVGKLIIAVDRLVVLPGLGEGVWWEGEQIKAQGRVGVTTFVMPYGSTPDQGEQRIWQSCREKFSALGFHFPAYDREGMLMRLNSEGQVVSRVPIIGTGIEELRTFILTEEKSLPIS